MDANVRKSTEANAGYLQNGKVPLEVSKAFGIELPQSLPVGICTPHLSEAAAGPPQ